MTLATVNYTKSSDECMKQLAEKDRKELEAKLANVFQENINELSPELREILLDDMVTAFENRLNVLNREGKRSDN
jgi:hypothetical protein